MLYLSQLLGAHVDDEQGEHLGKLHDILTLISQVGSDEATYPTTILVEGDDEQYWRLPINVLQRSDHSWRLTTAVEQFALPANADELTKIHADEISLWHQMLDKQVIDLEHKKAIRVNDIGFADNWQIVGVDNTSLGLLRRLAPSWLLGQRGRSTRDTLIPWQRIELISSQTRGHIDSDVDETSISPLTPPVPTPRTPSGHLSELHPADIATIIHQLTPEQGARVIERLDDETAAETMEEVDTERQRLILENIPSDRAADILQMMGPDEAADLLAQMSDESQQQLLQLMNPDESEDVQELLEYEPDTAGGLMTTDYIVLNQTRSAEEALTTVRKYIQEQAIRTAYVYCVEDETQDESRLLGVISLWDLLAAPASQSLSELMETDIISVKPDDDPRNVAEKIARYNLLAVPVVNEEGILEGIVTVDDALDVLLPSDHRRKPRKMY